VLMVLVGLVSFHAEAEWCYPSQGRGDETSQHLKSAEQFPLVTAGPCIRNHAFQCLRYSFNS